MAQPSTRPALPIRGSRDHRHRPTRRRRVIEQASPTNRVQVVQHEREHDEIEVVAHCDLERVTFDEPRSSRPAAGPGQHGGERVDSRDVGTASEQEARHLSGAAAEFQHSLAGPDVEGVDQGAATRRLPPDGRKIAVLTGSHPVWTASFTG